MTAQGEDILAYLDHAITRYEETARAASKAVGGESWNGSDREVVVDLPGGDTVADGIMYGDLYESMKQQTSNHIALNDPASVLRRCAADRKLIAEHRPDGTGGCVTCARPEEAEEDSEGNSVSFRTASPHPCSTLRHLAEGYGWTESER
ncbi:DUF6221 family protein [[Kitasatospora] papulosa]|uniref:DUF6221 family protein n=1 Tax=[Kitasatospora] papulosa TaxID=1464011 RepID=UPI0036820D5F